MVTGMKNYKKEMKKNYKAELVKRNYKYKKSPQLRRTTGKHPCGR